jgi:glyceraldehyde 3-phosphate dehydrogenase
MLMELIPELRGKTSGIAMNVPVPNGSVVDLVCWHPSPVSVESINEVVRTASTTGRWQRILDYTGDPIVSSDIQQSAFSGTFDSLATMTLGERVSKTLTWFDNGWGYAHRVVDLVRRFAEVEEQEPAGARREN